MDQYQLPGHQVPVPLQQGGGTSPEPGKGGVHLVEGGSGGECDEAILQDWICMGTV